MSVDLVAKSRVLRDYYRGIFERYEKEIELALPNGLSAKRFIQHALISITKKPELFACAKNSIVSAVMTAASLGLIIDDDLGEAFIVSATDPISGKKVAQIIVGYQGFCVLAMRSGFVSYIRPRWVCDGDDFSYSFGLEDNLFHKPTAVDRSNEKITHFYVVVHLSDGKKVFNVMTRKEIEEARDRSPHYKEAVDKTKTIWHINFNWMGNKTVLRSEMKYIPLSPEMQLANKLDEMAEDGFQDLSDSLLKLPNIDEELEKEIIEDREEKKAQKRTQSAKEKNSAKVAQAMGELKIITSRKNG